MTLEEAPTTIREVSLLRQRLVKLFVANPWMLTRLAESHAPYLQATALANGIEVRRVFTSLLGQFLRAAIVFWPAEMFRLATAGSDCFIGTRPTAVETMEPRSQLWIWSHDYEIDPASQKILQLPDEFLLSAFLLLPSPTDQVGVWGFFQRDGAKLTDEERVAYLHATAGHPEQWMQFRLLYAMDGQTVVTEELAKVISAIHFMQLSVVSTERVQYTRQMRRSAERRSAPLPDLRIVALRKRGYVSADRDASKQPVEWNYRWLVRGHWRQQWYPSESAHKPVFILPHMKGPDDKPLKPPAEQAFVVIR